MFLFSREKMYLMSGLYVYECECAECGHKWTSPPSEKPPFTCPECESNDIEVLDKAQTNSG